MSTDNSGFGIRLDGVEAYLSAAAGCSRSAA